MNDLISRQDLLDRIQEVVFDITICQEAGKVCMPHGWSKGVNIVESIINDMPSIYPKSSCEQDQVYEKEIK